MIHDCEQLEHHRVVDQESAVLFDENHFSDELTQRLREPLLPDNRYCAGTSEYGDRLPSRKISLLPLVFLTDFLKVLLCYDRLHSVAEISNVPLMIDRSRCVHQIGHDRIGDAEDLLVGHALQSHVGLDSWRVTRKTKSVSIWVGE